MTEYIIDLKELVNPPKTDSISGREFGEQHAKDTKLAEHFKNGEKIVVLIDDTLIKAINDSFIKGFFSGLFESYRTKDRIEMQIEIRANSNFKNLFEKNLSILDAIYNP